MQISKRAVKEIIHCGAPIFVGAVFGLLAGTFCLLADWLIDFQFSELQRMLTFFGFLLIGLFFGIFDTVSRVVRIYKDKQSKW